MEMMTRLLQTVSVEVFGLHGKAELKKAMKKSSNIVSTTFYTHLRDQRAPV